MYIIANTKYVNKGKLVDKTELSVLDGFMMPSRNKMFRIGDTTIRDVCLLNKQIANPIVSEKVFKKYEKLIRQLADLLVADDDDGESYREALNQIEKFRLEVRNKYRKFLVKKELEKMSKQLSALQKEAMIRLIEIRNSYYSFQNSERRSR